MADQLIKLLDTLNNCVDASSRESDAKDLVLSIRSYFQDELSKPELDSAFPAVFDEGTGIISFLHKAFSSGRSRSAVIEVLDLFKYLIYNFSERVSPYVLKIKEICVLCMSQIGSSATEREKSLEVLLYIFMKGHWQQDLGVPNLINELFNYLSYQKPTPKVSQKIYHILGVISHHYPECMVTKSEKLLKMYRKELKKQLSSNKVSYPIVAGCMDGLAECLCTIAPDPEEDPDMYQELYGYLKDLSSPDEDLRVAQRAALSLIEKHSTLFRRHLFSEYRWWHNQLLKWLNKNPDDRKAGRQALVSFYQEIACTIQETAADENKAVLKYFISYFKERMLSDKISVYEMGEVIRGFGLFAGPCLTHLKPEDVQIMFTLLIQRAQQMYLNSLFVDEQKQKSIQNLPEYLESIANIILRLGTLGPDQFAAVQHLAVCLFQNFPHVPEKFQSSSVKAFTTLFYSLSVGKGVLFEDFIRVVVYQGVVRTCSHPSANDAELQKEQLGVQQIITYKNYVPLWLSFLNVESYEHREMELVVKKALVCKLFDQLVETILTLLKKLDLNTSKKTDWITTKEFDPYGGFQASTPQDFQIFYNLVDLCNDVLPCCDSQLFEKWIQPFVHCVIMESSQKPIVSGFYKLLAISLKIADNASYFTTSNESLCNLVCQFLEDTLARLKHYKGELQISCLQAVVAIPVCMVPRLLHAASEAFQIIFKIGRSFLKIAKEGLATLEKWTKSLPPSDIKPFLKEVLPWLDSYLQSKGVEADVDAELELLEKSKAASHHRRTLKRKVLTEKPDTELQLLQRQILHFLGPLESDIAEALLADQKESATPWGNSKKLIFNLPFKDMRPVIYLDQLLPRVVELALNCSDRHTRIAACELLHAIVMFMLGTSVQIQSADRSELSDIFQNVFLPLLQLGSCDSDQVVYQLFHPLVLQLCHWYSSRYQLMSKNTTVLVDTLLDALTDPADSGLRDIAAKCLHEFVVWTIKQHPSQELDKSPMNIRFIVKRIQLLCVHPSPSKRLGAALAFNSIYTVLREDEAVVNEFWLEMLYYLMQNLAQTKPEEVMTGSVTELENAVNHVERVLKDKAVVFNKPGERRRQPPGIGGVLLHDAVVWLLKECGHLQPEYRHKSMALVCSLAPLVTNCVSTRKFISDFTETEGTEKLLEICEGSTFSLRDKKPCVNAPQEVNSWLQLLLASLDCYVFLIGQNLVALDLIKHPYSRIQEATQYFLQHIALEGENQAHELSPSIINEYKLVKCTCIVRFFDFLVAVMQENNVLQFIPEDYFGSSLWHLLSSCLFTSVQIGFDLRCRTVVKELPSNLERVLGALRQRLGSSHLLQNFYTILKQYVEKYAEPIFENLCEILMGNEVSPEQQAAVQAMMVLHRSEVLPHIAKELPALSSKILRDVFSALVEQTTGMAVSFQPSTQAFGEVLLRFAFSLQNQVQAVLNYIQNDSEVRNPNTQSLVQHGEYFLRSFQQCLCDHLLLFPEETVSGLLSGLTPDHGSQLLFILDHFLHHVEQAKKQKPRYTDRSALAVLQHWPVLFAWAQRSVENSIQLLILLKQVAACVKQPVGCFMQHEDIRKWIIAQLSNPDQPLDYKIKALSLLPCLTDSNQRSDEELRSALKNMRDQHFPQFSSELPPSSLQRDNFILAFDALLHALKVSGSPVLLQSILELSVGDKQHICEDNIQKSLPNFIYRLNVEQQLHAVGITYNIYRDDSLYDPQIRIGCAQRFLIPLLRACKSQVLEQFFVAHVQEMLSVLVQKVDSSRTIRMENQLVTQIVSWQLFEVLFSCLPIRQLESPTCSITKAAFPDTTVLGKELITGVTRKGLIVRTQSLPMKGKDSPAVVNLFHSMQCAAYRTVAVLLSNSNKEAKFFAGLLFNENKEKNEVIWENLVDCSRNLSFPMDWDELPRRKKIFVSIRKEAAKDSVPVQYIPLDSQILFSSTLAEDVTRFDLSTSVVREAFNAPPVNHSTELEMELDILNSHECMATLCAVIQHLGSSPPPEQPTSLPTWMECLKKSLISNHQNARAFITKLIINNQTVFKPYAKFWLSPIMQVIVDNCFGLEINYMVTDTIEMLTSWSSEAIPSTTETEKLLASQILDFLMKNASHSLRGIFKYNLELIKTVVEVWKACLNVPHQFIFDQLNTKSGNVKTVELGIHLTGILLANGVQPWSHVGKESFLDTLSSHLSHNDRSIFRPCSEVVGMALKFLDPELTGQLSEEDVKFQESVNKRLQAHQSKCVDVFLHCLYGIHKHYALVVDTFLSSVLYQLAKVSGVLKENILELILARLELLGSSAFIELKGKGLIELLRNREGNTQFLALRLVHKMLPNLDRTHVQELLDIVVELTSLKNVKCRAVTYQILMWAFDHHILGDEYRGALLAGLLDSDKELRETVIKFWSEEHHLPMRTPNRLETLLSTLYSADTEEHFLGYATRLLMNGMNDSPDYEMKIFQHPLSECSFQDMQILASWRARHASIAPMFADTFSSQLSHAASLGGESFPKLRATQTTLAFQPTMDIDVNKKIDQIASLSTSSSLMFSVDSSGSSNLDIKRKNQPMPSDDKIFRTPRRQRFLRDQRKLSSIYASYEARKAARRQQLQQERVHKREANVALYRRYRTGDFPDIEIQYSAILKPLQVLAEHDDMTGRQVLVSMFSGVMNKLTGDEADQFAAGISTALGSILNKSIQNTPMCIGAVLEMALAHSQKIALDIDNILKVSKASGLYSLGILLLEEKQITLDTDSEPVRKKRPQLLTEEHNCWLHLAELYQNLDEWDVVHGVFSKKIRCNDNVKLAIEAESDSRWDDARQFYEAAIRSEDPDKQKDFYYEAYFKCLAHLSQWKTLHKCIEQQLEGNLDYLWEDEWNKTKLLPWLFVSELQLIGFQDCSHFLQALQTWSLDREKNEHIKTYLNEELAVLCILNEEYMLARVYANASHRLFLEKWSHLNVSAFKQRSLTLRNLNRQSEIWMFLNFVESHSPGDASDYSDRIEQLCNQWQNNLPTPNSSLIDWDRRIAYRNWFAAQLKEHFEVSPNSLESLECDAYLAMIDGSLAQSNFYVAREYLALGSQKMGNSSDPLIRLRLNMGYSKCYWLRSRKTPDPEEKFKWILKAWDKLRECDWSESRILERVACQQTSLYAQDMWQLLGDNTSLLNTVGTEKLVDWISPSSRSNEAMQEALRLQGFSSLQSAVRVAEGDPNSSPKDIGDAYYKVAEYCQAMHGDQPEEPHVLVSILRAMKYGSAAARQLFPCLLQIQRLATDWKNLFDMESADVPEWMFLSWVNQLMACLNVPVGEVLHTLILRLAKEYPQAVIYPFRVSREKFTFGSDVAGQRMRSFVHRLETLLGGNSVVEVFLKSFSCLAVPEILLGHHLSKLITIAKEVPINIEQLESAYNLLRTEAFQEWDVSGVKIRGEAFSAISSFSKPIDNAVQLLRVAKENSKGLEALENIQRQVRNPKRKEHTSLRSYSPWLHEFQGSHLIDSLEVPGQYTGESRPLPQHHTRIVSFQKQVKVIRSLRRPLQITILGNDAKEYRYLIKYGEDLRQDQRIEQMFGLMNKILMQDPACCHRKLRIITYQVIPLSCRMGMIQWVDGAETFNSLISEELTEEQSKQPVVLYRSWLYAASNKDPRTYIEPIDLYGRAYREYSRSQTVTAYYERVNTIPWDIFKKVILNLSSSPEDFFIRRHNFTCSYGVLCISHWLLGIGDRHLENNMLLKSNCCSMGIDFGCAFGTATQFLPVPELMPFRMTPHILNLLQPLREIGLLTGTMVHSLRALRAASRLLLATMDVFIQEPSMDWLETVHKQQRNMGKVTDESEWYPRQKVLLARRKLEGANPVSVASEELQTGTHQRSPYLSKFLEVVRGDYQQNVRARLAADNLTPHEQVECLLDMATDPHILGKTYEGWRPWV